MLSNKGKIKNELIEDGERLLWNYNYDFGIAMDLINRLLDYIDKNKKPEDHDDYIAFKATKEWLERMVDYRNNAFVEWKDKYNSLY
jgi:hypothetical protein